MRIQSEILRIGAYLYINIKEIFLKTNLFSFLYVFTRTTNKSSVEETAGSENHLCRKSFRFFNISNKLIKIIYKI